jgi:tRNA(fMet)-specific endonuclease VapC
MTLYVLDTDQLRLFSRGHESVHARLVGLPPEQVAITVVTAEEQLGGWYTQLRQAKNAEKLTRAYKGLFDVLQDLKRIQVLPFTAPAVERYLELRRSLPRLGRMDLAIAAIVLEVQGVLVTRSRNDFEQVPGLPIEDWSRPTT